MGLILRVVMTESATMMTINSREGKILKEILMSQTYVSAEELSRITDLSPRQVRYSCHKIYGWLKNKETELIIKPGKGFFVDIPRNKKVGIFEELTLDSQKPEHLTPDERMYWIIYSLLDSNEPIVAKQLSQKLKVSRTTVSRDLKRAGNWLHGRNLELVSRQNYGSIVKGCEIDLRSALAACIMEAVGEIKLLNLFEKIGNSPAAQVIFDHDHGWITKALLCKLELRHFIKLVEQINYSANSQYSDSGYLVFILKLAILLRRVMQGNVLPDSYVDRNALIEKRGLKIAKILKGDLQRCFNVSFPRVEGYYLEDLVHELDCPGNRAALSDRKQIIAEEEAITDFVEDLMTSSIKYLHPSLKTNEDLPGDLIAHLMNSLISENSIYQDKIELTAEVQQEFPFVYKVVNDCTEKHCIKFDSIDLLSEVGYLTMHLAAAMESIQTSSTRKKKIIIVCNSGVATTKLLIARMKTEFPELEVVGTMSYLDYKRQDIPCHDLVISTIPIEVDSKPCFFVKPLLSEHDVLRIYAFLRKEGRGTAFVNSKSVSDPEENIPLSQLLNTETIKPQVSVKDWREAVDKAGGILVKSGDVKLSYIKAIKNIIESYGPYMVIMPGVALLHAFPGDGVNNLSMSLITLKEPVNFYHDCFDPVFCAIVLGATDNKSHLRALSEMADMLNNQETIDAFKTTHHKARILREISLYSQKQNDEA